MRRRGYEHTHRQKIEVAVSQGSCEQNSKSSYENLCCICISRNVFLTSSGSSSAGAPLIALILFVAVWFLWMNTLHPYIHFRQIQTHYKTSAQKTSAQNNPDITHAQLSSGMHISPISPHSAACVTQSHSLWSAPCQMPDWMPGLPLLLPHRSMVPLFRASAREVRLCGSSI